MIHAKIWIDLKGIILNKKKLISKYHTPYDSFYITFFKWQNYRDGEETRGYQGLETVEGGEGMDIKTSGDHWGYRIVLPVDCSGGYTYLGVRVCSVIQSCLTLCDSVTHQAHLSMEFSWQWYWSGLPLPPPGDHPNLGIKPTSPASPELSGGFFTTEPSGKSTHI